jgi:hypothetical protein
MKKKELEVFFHACEKNSISYNTMPSATKDRSDAIVTGADGTRYRLKPDLKMVKDNRQHRYVNEPRVGTAAKIASILETEEVGHGEI